MRSKITLIEIIRNILPEIHFASLDNIDLYSEKYNIGFIFDKNINLTERLSNKPHNYFYNERVNYKNNGIKVIHLFEDEIIFKTIQLELILRDLFHLKNKIKLDQNSYQIVENQYETDINNFIQDNSIEVNINSTINICAKYNDEIIGLLLINYNESGYFVDKHQILYFSCNKKYESNNIMYDLLEYFKVNYKPKTIISIKESRWISSEENTILCDLGFKIIDHMPADYRFYNIKLNDTIRHNKNIFLEDKNLIKSDFDKIWNSGRLMYSLKLDDNQNIIFGSIYKITNKINNKIYFGQTTRDINKRISDYKKCVVNTKHIDQSMVILSAMRKYEFTNFIFEVIDYAKNQDELNDKEIYYISKYDSTNKQIGYNTESGGNRASPSEDTRIKMSKAGLGRKQSPDSITKRTSIPGSPEALKRGRPKTDEQKKWLSENSPKYWLGKKRDPEMLARSNKTRKDKGITQKQIDGYCKTVYKINITTFEITQYYSISEAARQNKNHYASVLDYCNKKDIKFNCHWTYLKPYWIDLCGDDRVIEQNKWLINVIDENDKRIKYNRDLNKQNRKLEKVSWVNDDIVSDNVNKTKMVYRTNVLSGEIKEYASVAEAGRDNEILYSTMFRYCKNNCGRGDFGFSFYKQ